MDDFYNKLVSFKALNSLKWKDIGDVIGMKEATIRLAVKRESLTDLEKRELEEKLLNAGNKALNDENPINEPVSPYEVDPLTIEEIKTVESALKHHFEELMKNEAVKLTFTFRASQWVKNILEN